MIHFNFYGVYGIDNIKEMRKHDDYLKGIHRTTSIDNMDRITKVLDAVHSLHKEPFIFADHTFKEVDRFDNYVNWFIENKCNYKNVQYRLDRYYWVGIYGPESLGNLYMCIVVLKTVIYADDTLPIKLMYLEDFSLNHTEGIDKVSGYKEINEEDQEFKDAFIVARGGRERVEY